MTMTLSICSSPVSVLYGPTRSRLLCSMRLSAGYRVALISDDLPAPLTPVTATITPSGTSTSTFCRLCSRAPVSLIQPLGARRASGSSIRSVPARKRPVIEADVEKEGEPVADLLQDLARDLRARAAQRERVHERVRLAHGHRRDVDDRLVADEHRARLRPQARPAAAGARDGAEEALVV